MLYYIFTVDGDWKEYFKVKLTEDERAPRKDLMQRCIESEISLARQLLDGHFIHFIHSSPRARVFFIEEPFMDLWSKILSGGGEIGIHCHEDDPFVSYYYEDIPRMKEAISNQVKALKSAGLDVRAYRGGFLAFCSGLVKILEENGLIFDFSCEPDRYLVHNNQVVSDWRGAPYFDYRMSSEDHRREGDSNVYEIPLGRSGDSSLYFELATEDQIEKTASDLKKKCEDEGRDIIVSVLTHSNEYDTPGDMKNTENKINILKKFGQFIGLKEALEIIT